MTRLKFVAAFGVPGLLAAWILAAAAAAPVPPQRATPGEKWEYGEFHCGYLPKRAKEAGGGRAKLHFPASATIRWVTRKATVEASFEAKPENLPRLKWKRGDDGALYRQAVEEIAWEEMIQKLKVPDLAKAALPLSHRIRVFNRLGEEGWELAAYQPGERQDVWVFKRKVK